MTISPDLLVIGGATDILFVAALVLVQVFDTALPQGDRTDTSIGLVVALIFLRPIKMVVAAVVLSRLVSGLLPMRRGPKRTFVPMMSSLLALISGYVVMQPVSYWSSRLFTGPLGSLAEPIAVVTTGLAYLAVQQVVEQVIRSLRRDQRFTSLLLGNLRLQGYLSVAALSISLLLVLIHPYMGFWGLALCVMLLLVIRQAFNLLIEAKQAYAAVVRVLLRAMEAQNPGHGGHSERLAALAVATARELGIQGKRAERISYAALFHDIGVGGIAASEFARQVHFLNDVVPILSVLESRAAGAGPVLIDAAIIGFAHDALGDTGEAIYSERFQLSISSRIKHRLSHAVSRARERIAV